MELDGNKGKDESSMASCCSVCYEPFSDSSPNHLPRLLTCGHSYCTACLVKLQPPHSSKEGKRSRKQKSGLRCPKCRRVTALRQAGVAGVEELACNFDLINLLSLEVSKKTNHANRPTHPKAESSNKSARSCVECKKSAETFCVQCEVHLCLKCDQRVVHSLKALQHHSRVPSANAPLPMPFCAHHGAKKVEMWCEKDSVPVCTVCITGSHKDHAMVDIQEGIKRVKENASNKLANSIGEVEAAIKREEALTAVEEKSERQAVKNIRMHFDRLREAVVQREKELMDNLAQRKRVRIESADQRRGALAKAKKGLQAARGQVKSTSANLFAAADGSAVMKMMEDILATTRTTEDVCRGAQKAVATVAAAFRSEVMFEVNDKQSSSNLRKKEMEVEEIIGESGRLIQSALTSGVVSDLASLHHHSGGVVAQRDYPLTTAPPPTTTTTTSNTSHTNEVSQDEEKNKDEKGKDCSPMLQVSHEGIEESAPPAQPQFSFHSSPSYPPPQFCTKEQFFEEELFNERPRLFPNFRKMDVSYDLLPRGRLFSFAGFCLIYTYVALKWLGNSGVSGYEDQLKALRSDPSRPGRTRGQLDLEEAYKIFLIKLEVRRKGLSFESPEAQALMRRLNADYSAHRTAVITTSSPVTTTATKRKRTNYEEKDETKGMRQRKDNNSDQCSHINKRK